MGMKTRFVRKRMVFTGAVQGVGFRWRARHAASLCGCTGFCRNEWDGSVLMEIQGTEEAIDRVIMMLREGHFIRIDGIQVTQIPPQDERSFRTE